MSKSAAENRNARLKARIRRVVEETEIIRLARADQIRFAQALIDPPKPNRRLARAAKRHSALVERR
jgi:uncharacterized protein (DUF1778 family)